MTDEPASDQATLVAVGDRLTLEIGDIAHGGACVAHHEDGRVVFVRHALPGERVVARVTRVKDRFLFADAMEVLESSADRVTPPCRYAGAGTTRCGGCDFQHVALPAQRELKARVIREQLVRLGRFEPDDELLSRLVVEPVRGDADGLRWRTRIQLAVRRDGTAGFHPFHSNAVLPVVDCLIATEDVVGTGALSRRYPKATEVDVVASSTGERAVVVVPTGLRETPTLHEKVSAPSVGVEAEFRLGARGFWQVHPGAAAAFVEAVISGLEPRPGERCLDLYAGVGLFARVLAERVGPEGAVLAIESDRRAVASALDWAGDLEQVEVRCERVDRGLAPLIDGGDVVDLVVLDPPRAGAGAAVVADIAATRPRAIAYVACDPAALARDLATFRMHGYAVSRLTAYDAFPMTHHVECVAILTPDQSGEAG